MLRVEKQLKPLKERDFPNDSAMMVSDNVSFHHAAAIKRAMRAARWFQGFFPPNMTDELQPQDLVANAVFKADMRRRRCVDVFEAMQVFRAELIQWAQDVVINGSATRPQWKPPKGNYMQTVQAVFACVRGRMTEPDFMLSMNRCFIKVGLEQQYNECGDKVGFVNMSPEN